MGEGGAVTKEEMFSRACRNALLSCDRLTTLGDVELKTTEEKKFEIFLTKLLLHDAKEVIDKANQLIRMYENTYWKADKPQPEPESIL